MRTPRVSIGLTVYNGEKFLRQTMDSILNQTFTDFELIVSDNASSDATEAICRQYASKDTRIRYTRNLSNIGLNRNFNRAFELSSGEYFRWSAADDVFEPTSLEECVNVLDQHPEVVLCYPKTVLIDAEGNVLRSYADNLDLRLPSAAERFRLVLHNIGLANVQYGLIRVSALRHTALFGGFPGADIALIAELSLHGQFWEIPRELFYRRMHDDASSAMKNKPWASVQQFWNASSNGGVDLYYWTHRYHNLAAVLRSPASAFDKVRSISALGMYAFRSRDIYIRELVGACAHLTKRLLSEQGANK